MPAFKTQRTGHEANVDPNASLNDLPGEREWKKRRETERSARCAPAPLTSGMRSACCACTSSMFSRLRLGDGRGRSKGVERRL